MNNIENQIDDAAAEFATNYARGGVSYDQAHADFITRCEAMESDYNFDYFCERWDEISDDAIEQYQEFQEYVFLKIVKCVLVLLLSFV